MALFLGTRLGRYEIPESPGAGGVRPFTQLRLGREVAASVLLVELARAARGEPSDSGCPQSPTTTGQGMAGSEEGPWRAS